MDFMTVLPVEVIEEILLYLTGNEIINCSKVCKSWEKFINEESLWRHLCVRKGFNAQSKQIFTNETSIQSWREFYWSMHNWQNMQYICHTVEDDGAIEQVQLCGSTMFVPGKGRVRVWNIKDVPKMEQELETITCKTDGFCLRVNGSFIVYESGSIVQIYQRNNSCNFSLSKIFFFNRKRLFECKSVSDLLEEYSNITEAYHLRDKEMNSYVLVELKNTTLSVFQGEVLFIWSLKTWSRHTVVIPSYVECVFAIRIRFPRFYLVTLIDGRYVIKVYDLKEGWVMDLLHITTEEQRLMLQPRLIVGDHYVVSAGVCVQDPMASSVIYLKVWKTDNGSLISTLNVPYCYFNCFLLNDIIILTISSNVIAVWDPLKNEKIRKLTLHDNKFSLINSVSSNLLVVSYSTFFEVWNWKTGIKLYETEPRYVCSYNQKMNSLFYIQPDADNNNLLPHDYNKPKKIIIFNFREQLSV